MIFDNNNGLTEDQKEIKAQLLTRLQSDYSKQSRKGDTIGSSLGHMDIDEFIDATKELIEGTQFQGARKVFLTDDGIEGNILENPHNPGEDAAGRITYSLERRSPASMSGGNTPFGDTVRDVKARIRQVITNDPENPGRARFVYTQWHDNLVKFTAIARTSHGANKMALWFEEVMEKNRLFYALKGAHRYYMYDRLRDERQRVGTDNHYYRPMLYYVRTESSYEIDEQAINEIAIRLTNNIQ